MWQSSDNALSACCDAVCESAACRTTVQRVEAKELSRVVGDNAAGIPSLLSGKRKTHKPKHRPVPGNLDSSSSAIHRRAEDCPPYRRAILCLVGRFTP